MEANDYAAVNQGQVKNIAVKAIAELNAHLPGGAGTVLSQLAVTLSGTTANTNDYAAVNLGQLKNLAQPFYDRLIEIGYSYSYPWVGKEAQANDYAMANIGQVKNLFSFDLMSTDSVHDADEDGLPDWWEHCFGIASGTDPNALTPRGGSLTYLQALKFGFSPLDFYHGTLPNFTTLNGTDLSDEAGAIKTISVKVTDANNNPIPGAPVDFSTDYGLLQAVGSNAVAQKVEVTADSNGNAAISVMTPWWPDVAFTVTAEAATGELTTGFTFTGTTSADNPDAPALPDVQTPTLVSEPTLSVKTSGTFVYNPAFRQFTSDTPENIHWYLVKTSTSRFTYSYSDDYLIESSTGIYFNVETRHPLFDPGTYAGHSEWHGKSNYVGNTDSNADQSSDGSWLGTYTTSSDGNAPVSWTIHGPPYSGDFYFLTDESPTDRYYDDEGEYSSSSARITLSNEYTRPKFTTDVINTLIDPTTWYDYGLGSPIAWRHLADDASSFSVAKGSYKFKCTTTGTTAYKFEWYEVFQPDDDPSTPDADESQNIQVTHREWDNANAEAESPEFTIDPSTQQKNGTWYIARLDTQTVATCPECQWRHSIGIGEKVTAKLDGLPPIISGSATWKADPSTSGTLTWPSPHPNNDFIAGRSAGNVTITATLPGGASFSTALTVKAPTGVRVKKVGSISHSLFTYGAGMWCQYYFLPADVSFWNCQFREGKCPPSNMTGFYLFRNWAPEHNPNLGGNPDDPNWIGIRFDNTAADSDAAKDFVEWYKWAAFTFPGGSGFSWVIPVFYKLTDDPDSVAVQLQTVTQTMNIAPPSSKVTKGDAHEP